MTEFCRKDGELTTPWSLYQLTPKKSAGTGPALVHASSTVLTVSGIVSDAQGLTKTSVTCCSVEFHMTNAPNCSETKRTGNIVRPGAWMYGTTAGLLSIGTRTPLTNA